MKKSSLLLILPLLTLGVFSILGSLVSERNVIQKAKAESTELSDGKYFISYNDEYGLGIDENKKASKDTYSTFSTPVNIEKVNDEYYIYHVIDSVKYYLSGSKSSTDSQLEFRLESSMGDTKAYNWTFEINGSGKYRAALNSNYYLVAGDYYFRTRSASPSDYFVLDIVNLDTSCVDLINSINSVHCDNGLSQPSKDEWDEIETPYTALSEPLKNYLQTANYDSEHPENNTDLENALMKYDYIVSKYRNEKVGDNPKYTNYLLREVIDIDYSIRITFKEDRDINYLLVGVVSFTFLISVVTLIGIRKKEYR